MLVDIIEVTAQGLAMSSSKNPLNSPIIKFFCIFIFALLCVIVWGYFVAPQSENSSVDGSTDQTEIEVRLDVDQVAEKTPEEVVSILGEPSSQETVTPSNTPCPCDKFIYRGGKVEIVYINGKADWITAKYPPSLIKGEGPFLSVDQFPSYSFVKVKTP
ncbi:hypothetical protein D0962_17780 [Leptolyngbyaceae cyanobacterium CCMR0082]|uniref:Uncharacterized protein n=1 Tax=Adonisia turfae CCMR0082 TaxID=2304604 RepID=A0A6M0S810_9CYAN|nr:hypothetical protein [Adonisia turfae]NEZ64615.1 hypothetical protein [Adonisia turfae CCMR0082]